MESRGCAKCIQIGGHMIKVAILGIIVTLFCVYFKAKQPEISTAIALVCCIFVFSFAITKLEVILDAIRQIQSYIQINNTYITILLKIVGITYVAEFSSGLCKDAGYSAIANQIELVGKLSIIAISMPIVLALINTLNQFLNV